MATSVTALPLNRADEMLPSGQRLICVMPHNGAWCGIRHKRLSAAKRHRVKLRSKYGAQIAGRFVWWDTKYITDNPIIGVDYNPLAPKNIRTEAEYAVNNCEPFPLTGSAPCGYCGRPMSAHDAAYFPPGSMRLSYPTIAIAPRRYWMDLENRGAELVGLCLRKRVGEPKEPLEELA